ncbi:MAG: sigma-70 family RNA polymerase sigma factor [Gammaproteobacteria bacterium]|nr:MAG: sigma-70 family RNA polymerase sigma factor [Gammaproteobacteria bacterium]
MRNSQVRFEKLVNAVSSDLYRYAFMLCRNKAMAEDLVQETFMRAWRFLDSLREEKKAKSWLMTTLRREFARQFERYRPPFADVELDQIAGSDGVNPEVWEVRRGLARLPDKYREVLVLQVIGGYSGAEMAEMLELPRATVNTRLFRARQQLRKQLESGAGTSAAREGRRL